MKEHGLRSHFFFFFVFLRFLVVQLEAEKVLKTVTIFNCIGCHVKVEFNLRMKLNVPCH